MSFIPYPHIERVGKEDVEGIIAGDCYIFPKIDGTNASVWRDEVLCFGSRKRQLTLEDDNAGFMAENMNNTALKAFFEEFPDYHLFGEWLVPHTFKGYTEDAWRKFYVFDVGFVGEDGELKLMPYEQYKPLLDKHSMEYIPAVKIIANPSDDELKHELDNNFYLCGETDKPGEGIVIKNYEYFNKWGRQTWAKIVRDEFKYANIKVFGTSEGGVKKVEEDIVNGYVTEAFCLKEYNKIMNPSITDGEPVNPKSVIPRVIETIWHELIQEETWNFIKENNCPTINFKLLRALCVRATKQHLPQMFL